MPGLDSLLAKTVAVTIGENLGERTLQRIKQRLFERHGLNLVQAIEDFTKLHDTLTEFFGEGAAELERQFMSGLVALETSERQEKSWMTIEDHRLAIVILQALGDDDKNKILNIVLDTPMIISDILSMLQISQTFGYGKINSLIEQGLLVPEGHVRLDENKHVVRYQALFENIQIYIQQNKVTVKILVHEKYLMASSLIKIACCR